MSKIGHLNVSRLGWALALAFGIVVWSDDSHAGNRSPAIDRDATWSEEEFKATESLLQSRAPASASGDELAALLPGPGIDRAIRVALAVDPRALLPEFLVERLRAHAELARERIELAVSNPDAPPRLKEELSALRSWISNSI
jgi:hypothetical protein